MECVLNSNFCEMNTAEIELLDGGTFWGVVGGGLTVTAGAAEVVGGVALLGAPEPTGITKYAGGAAIATGVGSITGGIVKIASNI